MSYVMHANTNITNKKIGTKLKELIPFVKDAILDANRNQID